MRRLLAISFLLCFVQSSFGQLSGSLSDTLGPGSYNVTDTITVDALDSLLILPGTTFLFDGPYPFMILGTLLAEGTESDSIVFTADTVANPGRWRGLRFYYGTSSDSRLAYCLIENGRAIGDNYGDSEGGGVLCANSSPDLSHCVISDNEAVGGTWFAFGGGVICRNEAAPTFSYCIISRNHADYGGGVYFNHSQPVFTNCLITGNSVSSIGHGGGAQCIYSDASFIHCTFYDNSTSDYWPERGGGMQCEHCSLTVKNTIIAASEGAGIFFDDCAASQVTYCDIYGSSIRNIGFLSDDPNQGPADIGVLDTTNANGDSCDVYQNIFWSPSFVDEAASDFHLKDYSHCIGAGDTAGSPPDDIEGNVRPDPPGSMPDIGAYENENDTITLPAGISGVLSGVLGPDTINILDTIYVNVGDTLRLMPGTRFEFYGPFPFRIEGTLLAEGTETDSIIFTTDDGVNPTGWRGLRFYNSGSSGSQLSYCVIEKGNATGSTSEERHGGGAYCDHSSPEFTHCTFRNNSSQYWGGAISCWYGSPTVSKCAILNNSTGNYGGGFYSWYSSPDFTNCIFNANTSLYGGGACCSGSSPSFTHCTFSGNSAPSDGAGIICFNSSPILKSTIIAFSEGNGLHFWNASSSQVENCDFYGNSGGDFSFGDDDSSHGPPDIGVLSQVNANGDSSDIYLNIYLSPSFIDSTNDLHLNDASYCIGAALFIGPDDDFEGNPRPNPPGSRPDIGAYENENGPAPPAGLSGSLSGTLGPDTFTVIDTIYISLDDTLVLLPGTVFHFYNPFPFEIYGTLIAEGTETDSIVFAADPQANPLGWRGLRFLDYGSSGSSLSYCLIRDGVATGTTTDSKHGGGAYCDYSSPSFTHCVFRDNSAQAWGGAISCWYGSPTITKCTFDRNSSGSFGGGIYSWYSSPIVTNCIFTGDSSDFGGAIYCSGGTPSYIHCTLSGNTAGYNGSGIYCLGSPIINGTIIANSNGAALYFNNSAAAQISYCDFFGNSGGNFAYVNDDSTNAPTGIGDITTTNAVGDSCDIYLNSFQNPNFVNLAAGDFHLQDTSHCIGAAEMYGPDEDIEGNPRPNPFGSLPDIGAYENENGPPVPSGLAGSLSDTLGPGVYHVLDTIYVSSGDSLRLMPGTTFIFDGPYPFRIEGALHAEGTESDSIFFLNNGQQNPGLWRGIRFFGTTRAVSRLTYCLFENSHATGTDNENYGGAVYCNDVSPFFAHCVFQNCAATWGGAVSCKDTSAPVFESCILKNNTSTAYGGGIYSWDSSPVFTNCIFNGNTAPFGGAITCADGSSEFYHCTLEDNTADDAAALCIYSTVIFNSTIISFSDGSGMHFWGSPACQVEYCDFFGNSDGDFSFSNDDSSEGPADIGTMSQLNANGDSCDTYNNILLHPTFVNRLNNNYHLNDPSPCIGAAEDGSTDDDFDGNPRPNPGGSHPDIGAYENENAAPVPSQGLIGNLSGIIGPGIFHVIGEIYIQSGDSLRLMPGTTFIFDGAFPFEIEGTLLAEGAANDSIFFTADIDSNPDHWRGLRFLGSSRSLHRLSYCVIENGFATGNDHERNGGGAYFNYSSADLSHCVFRNNEAEIWGGGVTCWYSSPSFTDCIFEDNVSGSFGGGLYSWDSSPTFTNCVFTGDSSLNGGGAYCSGESPNFTRCTFSGNAAASDGAGFAASHGTPILNTTIVAYSEGDGVYFWDAPGSQVEFCDIFGNSGDDIAFTGDDPAQGPAGIGDLSQENVNGDSCDVYFNIFVSPLFEDSAAGDFQITEFSLCIDAGDTSLSNDPDGTLADIGAFYYHYGSFAPSPFSLISPQWGDTCWTLDTTIIWHATFDLDTNDVVSYEIWLDTLSDLSTAWEVDTGLSDTMYVLNTLADDYEYYWTIHASDSNTSGTWADDTLMFHTYFPESPDTFALAEPANGSTVNTETPTLRWNKAPDPDPNDVICYQVFWSYQSDFSVFEDTTICDTSFTFPAGLLFSVNSSREHPTRASRRQDRGARELDEVEDDSTVYWKVKAMDSFGFSVWCDPAAGWNFNVYIEQQPNAFDLISPTHNDTLDTLSAEFVWNASDDPDPGDSIAFYRFYLALDSNFTTGVDSQDVSEATHTWNNLTDDQIYWWRVKAYDTHGNGILSNQAWRFSVFFQEPPETFALAEPVNGSDIAITTPTLRWHQASDPDPGDTVCYRLLWSYESDFSAFEDTTLCDTSFTFPQGLLLGSNFSDRSPTRVMSRGLKGANSLDEIPDDSTVYWKVEALDGFGFSTWCTPEEGWSFHVYIEQPPNVFDLISPTQDETIGTQNVTFAWEANGDPDPGDSVAFYRIIIALDSNFTTGADSQDVNEATSTWNNLSDDQTYWWRVKAFDTHGNETLSNQAWRFYVYVEEPPNSYDLISPVHGDTLDTLSAQLDWSESSDPDPGDSVAFYRAYLAFDVDFTTGVDSQEVSDTDLSWENLEDDRTYWWRVKAFDTQGNGTFSNQTRNFITYYCEVAPDFLLLEPTDSSQLPFAEVDFCWQALRDPDPLDVVDYTMYFTTEDTSFIFEVGSDTCLTVDMLAIDFGEAEMVEWWVEAHSVCPDTIQGTAHLHFYSPQHQPPFSFELIAPTWGDTCWTLDTILVWQTAIDPDQDDTVSYEVWLDTLANLSTSAEIASALSDTFVSVEELMDDHIYYWTVHASDLYTEGTWADDTLMFCTYFPEPPESFALAEPGDGDTVYTLTPTLRWRETSDPDPDDVVCYRVLWSYDSDFSEYEDTTVCDTSFTFAEGLLFSGGNRGGGLTRASRSYEKQADGLDDVEDDSTVYWKVQAVDRFGLASWCEPAAGWNFHVYIEEPPGSFDLVSPGDGQTIDMLAVQFEWSQSIDPDAGDSVTFYRVYLAFDSLFTTDLDSQEIADTELVWGGLEDDQTYWWRVRAFDTHGNGTFSNQAWNFSTYYCEIPSPFSLLEPADSLMLPVAEVNLCWQAARDPDPGDTVNYTLRLTTMDTSFFYDTGEDTCWTLDLDGMGLTCGPIVEWWVEAYSTCPPETIECEARFHFYPPSAVSIEDALVPSEFALHQNYPNPFNPTTTIRYDVRNTSYVSVKIYDLLGREISTLIHGRIQAGSYTVVWDATSLPSGVYLCRMQTAGFTQTRKLLLLK